MVKSSYFSTIKNKFIFANEIKAILSTKVDKKPNYNEFLRFMNFSQYDNGDQTYLKYSAIKSWLLFNLI